MNSQVPGICVVARRKTMQQSNEKELYKNENVHFKMVVLQTQNKKTKIKPFFFFFLNKEQGYLTLRKDGALWQ